MVKSIDNSINSKKFDFNYNRSSNNYEETCTVVDVESYDVSDSLNHNSQKDDIIIEPALDFPLKDDEVVKQKSENALLRGLMGIAGSVTNIVEKVFKGISNIFESIAENSLPIINTISTGLMLDDYDKNKDKVQYQHDPRAIGANGQPNYYNDYQYRQTYIDGLVSIDFTGNAFANLDQNSLMEKLNEYAFIKNDSALANIVECVSYYIPLVLTYLIPGIGEIEGASTMAHVAFFATSRFGRYTQQFYNAVKENELSKIYIEKFENKNFSQEEKEAILLMMQQFYPDEKLNMETAFEKYKEMYVLTSVSQNKDQFVINNSEDLSKIDAAILTQTSVDILFAVLSGFADKIPGFDKLSNLINKIPGLENASGLSNATANASLAFVKSFANEVSPAIINGEYDAETAFKCGATMFALTAVINTGLSPKYEGIMGSKSDDYILDYMDTYDSSDYMLEFVLNAIGDANEDNVASFSNELGRDPDFARLVTSIFGGKVDPVDFAKKYSELLIEEMEGD